MTVEPSIAMFLTLWFVFTMPYMLRKATHWLKEKYLFKGER